jgi:GNAT superfamily N-acetyltransferase
VPVELAVVDPASLEARRCLAAYVAELDSRFDVGFDPARSIPASEEELRPPIGLFLLATRDSEPIGCGALKLHGDEPAELKRMWVASSARGLGVGRKILARLEALAADAGASAVRLETNAALVEAIGLYRSAGYVEVGRFNDEAYADHWFEKTLEPR